MLIKLNNLSMFSIIFNSNKP